MEVKKSSYKPKDSDVSKVVTMGNITEVTTCKSFSSGPPVVKIDKDRYMDMRTGAVGEYQHVQNRGDGVESLKKTIRRIRGLINANVCEVDKVRWLTLTYAENMTDTEKLCKDFDIFRKRLYRWSEGQGYGKPEYISVIEPQARGAWHIHAFLIWDRPAPYMDNNEVVWKMWGHGFTKIKSVTNCDNVGAYFSAYLTDVPVSEITGDETDKKIIKGSRLHLYPPGIQIVRHSRGVKKPEVEYMDYGKVKEHVKDLGSLTYSSTFDIIDTAVHQCVSGTVMQSICKEYYNRLR